MAGQGGISQALRKTIAPGGVCGAGRRATRWRDEPDFWRQQLELVVTKIERGEDAELPDLLRQRRQEVACTEKKKKEKRRRRRRRRSLGESRHCSRACTGTASKTSKKLRSGAKKQNLQQERE
jgi:hypothetical protein